MKFIHTFILILNITLLTACAASRSPEITPTVALKSTATGTVTPSATPTQRVIPTEQPIMVTPFPTQGSLSNSSFTRELLRTNGGCNLPCWWGMVPGYTRWEDAEVFLKSFTSSVEKSNEYSVQLINGESYIIIEYEIHINTGISKEDVFAVYTKDNVVSGFTLGSPMTDVSFRLGQMLKRQGIPTKIFIKAKSHPFEGWAPFDIVLYYKEQHFYSIYNSHNHQAGDHITACFESAMNYIDVIEPWISYNDRELIEQVRWDFEPTVLSVEEALNMTPTEFYNTYKDADPLCISSPANLWP